MVVEYKKYSDLTMYSDNIRMKTLGPYNIKI